MPRKLFSALLIAVLSLLLMEATLNILDPIGIRLNFHGQTRMAWVMVEDVSGYRVLAGDYYFASQTRILTDGSRAVPDSQDNADCSLAVIGDSVSFGWGVSDAETFANLIARDNAIRVINAARSGYNAGNIEKLYEGYQADAYLWLIIPNDVNIAWDTNWEGRNQQSYLPATWLYLQYLFPSANAYRLPEDKPTYERVINRFSQDERVLMIALEDDTNAPLSLDRIPAIEDFVSVYDHHPNAVGHRKIYEAMKPYIMLFLESVCQ